VRDWVEEEHSVVVGLVLRYAGTKAWSFFSTTYLANSLDWQYNVLLLEGLRVGLGREPAFWIPGCLVCERKGCSG
jgi:hypothetical protein